MVQMFSLADQRRMYNELAWAWPIVNPPADFAVETDEYIRLVRQYARIPIKTLANFGCGGGQNDFTLKKAFAVTGVDINETMLSLARELNPENTYVCGDMRAVRLGQQFDAVTVFDAINHMRTLDGLRAAFRTAHSHLKPGGVFITGMEETAETFRQNKSRCLTHARNDIEITLLENYYDPDPADYWYEAVYIYLIRRSGILSMETDCHHRGLFPQRVWLELMKEVGFEIHQDQLIVHEKDRELVPVLVGIRP